MNKKYRILAFILVVGMFVWSGVAAALASPAPTGTWVRVNWQGQGSENANPGCGPGELGFWHWIVTPPGGQGEFLDGWHHGKYTNRSTSLTRGFHQGGNKGAMHFNVTHDAAEVQMDGTYADVFVTFVGGNYILTISDSTCVPGPTPTQPGPTPTSTPTQPGPTPTSTPTQPVPSPTPTEPPVTPTQPTPTEPTPTQPGPTPTQPTPTETPTEPPVTPTQPTPTEPTPTEPTPTPTQPTPTEPPMETPTQPTPTQPVQTPTPTPTELPVSGGGSMGMLTSPTRFIAFGDELVGLVEAPHLSGSHPWDEARIRGDLFTVHLDDDRGQLRAGYYMTRLTPGDFLWTENRYGFFELYTVRDAYIVERSHEGFSKILAAQSRGLVGFTCWGRWDRLERAYTHYYVVEFQLVPSKIQLK
jgi:hypothetical protein